MMVVDDRFKLFLDDDDANSESDDEEQGLEDDDDTSSDNDEGSRYRSLLRNVDLDDQDDFIDDDDDDIEIDPRGREWPGHHLLNEVKKGGTISSLFAILSVFTDDVR